MRRYIIFIIAILLTQSTLAMEDYYQFQSQENQTRFETLTNELRCLVCQNQNLSQSNAPLADDLRKQIYQQIQQGQSDQAIIDYLVKRYGHFILYRPPFNILTLGLWLMPFVMLLLGLWFLIRYITRE